MDYRNLRGALILVDHFAGCRVAGLPQLERLLLALNEYAEKTRSPRSLPVCILGHGEESDFGALLPSNRRLTNISVTTDYGRFASQLADSADPILAMSTRLVVRRNGIISVVQALSNGESAPALLIAKSVCGAASFPSALAAELGAREKPASFGTSVGGAWLFLKDHASKRTAADFLWWSAGKPQDGFVSRYLNRPLSRRVSRLLVRLPITPDQWTLGIMILPLLGSILLASATYWGFALGATCFQLHSALDGCDGEIARVKYLDSIRGHKLDEACDRVATLLFVVSLGVGLFRQMPSLGWHGLYLIEGFLTASFIALSEYLLIRAKLEEVDVGAMKPRIYPRYLKVIKHSGVLFLGEKVVLFFVELTKRDVFLLGFMLLAFCGQPQWILHIFALSSVIGLILTLKIQFSGYLTTAPANVSSSRLA